jgi:hypothetical protein
MNRALKEIDQMKTEAWQDFATNVKATGKRLGKAGKKYIKTHPVLVLGGGALLGALLVSRVGRRPAHHALPRKAAGVFRILRTAQYWLGQALCYASEFADRAQEAREECRE